MKPVTGLVLCGGRGLRLAPFSAYHGKPLVPLVNRPLVSYTIERLVRAGITDIVLNHLGNGAELKGAVGDGSHLGAKIQYFAEDFQYGTGGVLHFLGDRWQSGASLVLTVADMISTLDLRSLLAFHHGHGEAVTFGAIQHSWSPAEWEGDVLRISDADPTEVAEFQYRPGAGTNSRTVATGTWVLERSVLDAVPYPQASFSVADNVDLNRDVFPQVARHGHGMRAFIEDHVFADLGDPASFVEGSVGALRGDFGRLTNVGTLEGGRIHASARIHPSAFVDEETVVGAEVAVGRDAWLQRCVLLPGATVPDGAAISSAMIADGLRTPDATRRMYVDTLTKLIK